MFRQIAPSTAQIRSAPFERWWQSPHQSNRAFIGAIGGKDPRLRDPAIGHGRRIGEFAIGETVTTRKPEDLAVSLGQLAINGNARLCEFQNGVDTIGFRPVYNYEAAARNLFRLCDQPPRKLPASWDGDKDNIRRSGSLCHDLHIL